MKFAIRTIRPLAVATALAIVTAAGAIFLFAVGMRNGTTTAIFTFKGIRDNKIVEVIGENRTLTTKNGKLTDRFGPWDVHLYRLK